MISDLLVNMAFIISFISLGSQLFKKREFDRNSSAKSKLVLGAINGFLGITLMMYSLHINQDTIIDLRNVAIVMAAIHGGAMPLLISSLMIAAFRLAFFGISISSLLGAASVIIIAIGCILIIMLKIKTPKKWIYSTLWNLIVSSITLAILLKDVSDLPILILVYYCTTIIISLIAYYYVGYCLTANSLFRKLKEESTKDFLTGLNNVRQFDSMFNYAINRARENNQDLSLLMADIDFFKKVNDTYGHAEGDIVLKELAIILSKNSRNIDIVSRNGGEEFTVLLMDCPKDQAMQIAERIRADVESHAFILSNGKRISITVSIGVASYPETAKELEKLPEEADVALYAAKRSGRNRVCSNF